MATQQLYYENKVTLHQSSVANKYKITANDMNDIKGVVNNNALELANIIPVKLYDDSNGTTGDITLSDSIANYSLIEIIYHKDGDVMNGSQKVQVVSGNAKCTLMGLNYYGGETLIYQILSQIVTIIGTSLTRDDGNWLNFSLDGSGTDIGFSKGTENTFYITQVIGYK